MIDGVHCCCLQHIRTCFSTFMKLYKSVVLLWFILYESAQFQGHVTDLVKFDVFWGDFKAVGSAKVQLMACVTLLYMMCGEI